MLEQKSSGTQIGKIALFFVGGAILGGLLTTGVFFAMNKKKAADTNTLVGDTLFKIDGTTYTSTNLPQSAAMNYYQLQSNIYNAKENLIKQIGLRISLAKQAGKSVDDLPELQELLPPPVLSDAEAKQFYDQGLAQAGPAAFGNLPFDKIKDELKNKLTERKYAQLVEQKMSDLQASGALKSYLTQPVAPAVRLNLAGYPARGNDKSSVTLVEVADYMCPHCRETEPSIEKIYKEFSDKVKFIHVSFPLSPKGLNGALARGAYCANAQGSDKFWSFHKLAFQVSYDKMKPQNTTDPETSFNEDAKNVAKEAGLDMNAFTTCLSSGDSTAYITKVQSDFNPSKGFQGTPTFYLNDRLIQASPAQIEQTLRTALSSYN